MKQLRLRAEAMLIDLRCADDGGVRFCRGCQTMVQLPQRDQQGGDLGWLTRADCAPEFAREVFGSAEIGVLARLVHNRFGLHVVEVVAREAGQQPSFEEVRQAIGAYLAPASTLGQRPAAIPSVAGGRRRGGGRGAGCGGFAAGSVVFKGYGRMSCRMSCSIACVGFMTMLSPIPPAVRDLVDEGQHPTTLSSAALTPDWFLTC